MTRLLLALTLLGCAPAHVQQRGKTERDWWLYNSNNFVPPPEPYVPPPPQPAPQIP